jgi:hypothetical protein
MRIDGCCQEKKGKRVIGNDGMENFCQKKGKVYA